MKRRFILPALAVVGFLIAIAVVIENNQPGTAETPPLFPANAPYASYVAGSGMIEASTGNIAVGTSVPGVVAEIYVALDQSVRAGQPLFKIDDRDLQAQLVTAEAKVNETAASLLKSRHQLAYSEDLKRQDPEAVSAQQLTELRDDTAIAKAEFELAQAQVEQIRLERLRRIVRAPVAGTILQLNMRLGEYVEASESVEPMLILGNEQRLNVRVEVDQQDAWRVRPGAAAVAFEQGNPTLRIPLDFEYVEPLVVPKGALTGRSTERTDTRVLQVVFSFQRDALPVYAGQQLDVYIQAPPTTAGSPPAGP